MVRRNFVTVELGAHQRDVGELGERDSLQERSSGREARWRGDPASRMSRCVSIRHGIHLSFRRSLLALTGWDQASLHRKPKFCVNVLSTTQYRLIPAGGPSL